MSNICLHKKKWTLDSARENYRKKHRKCENCEFVEVLRYSTYCNVKKHSFEYFTRTRARLCRYYTPKEGR